MNSTLALPDKGRMSGPLLIALTVIAIHWLAAAFVVTMLLSMAAGTIAYQIALVSDLSFRYFAWIWLGLFSLSVFLLLAAGRKSWIGVAAEEIRELSKTLHWGTLLALVLLFGAALGVLNSTWTDDDWGHLQRLGFAFENPARPITLREDFLPPPFNQSHAYFIPFAYTHMYGAIAWLSGADILQLHFNVGGAFGVTAFLLGSYILLRAAGAERSFAVLTVCIMFAYCSIDMGWHSFANRVIGKPWMMKHLSLITMTPLLLAALTNFIKKPGLSQYLLLLFIVTAATGLGLNTTFGLPVALGGFGLALLATANGRQQLTERFTRLLVAATTCAPWLFVALHYAVFAESEFREWAPGYPWTWHFERAFHTPEAFNSVWQVLGRGFYVPPLEFILLLAALIILVVVWRRNQATMLNVVTAYFFALLILLNPFSFQLLARLEPGLSLTFFRLFYVLLAPLAVAQGVAVVMQMFPDRIRIGFAATGVAVLLILVGIAPRVTSIGPSPLSFAPNVAPEFMEQVAEIASLKPPNPVFSYHRFAKAAPLLARSMTHLFQSRGGLLNSANRTELFDVATVIDSAFPVFHRRGTPDQMAALASVLSNAWACSVVAWKPSRGYAEVADALIANGYHLRHETIELALYLSVNSGCGDFNNRQ